MAKAAWKILRFAQNDKRSRLQSVSALELRVRVVRRKGDLNRRGSFVDLVRYGAAVIGPSWENPLDGPE
jgi:hypothetical protein